MRTPRLILFTSLSGLIACGTEPELELEPGAAQSKSALFGTVGYATDCPTHLRSFHSEGVRRGRMASTTRAFEQCIEGSASAAIPAWDGDIGPYQPCTGDSYRTSSEAIQTDRLLRVARSANDLDIECTGGRAGATASSGGGEYGYWIDTDEGFNWTAGVLQQFYDDGAANDWNRAYADVANVTWHETMHRREYQHLDTGQSASACGYSTYSNWFNSAPYIVGRCVRAVLVRSDAMCGLDSCGHNGLMMIERYVFGAEDSPVACTCIEDPQDNTIGLIEYDGFRLRHLTLEDAGDSIGAGSTFWSIQHDDEIVATGDFDENGSDDVVIMGSPYGSRGLAFARFDTTLRRLVAYLVHHYGDSLGTWQLEDEDRVAAVGDFVGSEKPELLMRNDWRIGILYRDPTTNTLRDASTASYGTYLGTWYLRSTDTIYGAGDFDGGDANDEFIIQGTSGLAVIEHTTSGMRALRHVSSGEWIGSYQYNASDVVQGVGDVNGDGRADIVLKGPSGLVVLGYASSGFAVVHRIANEANAGAWHLESSDIVRGIGDFNDDGRQDILLQRGAMLGVLYRNSSGSLVEYIHTTFAQTPAVRAIGDFQGTGRDHLIVDYPNGGMELLIVGSSAILPIEANAYQDQDETASGFWSNTGYLMLGSWPLQKADFFPYNSAMKADRRFRGVGDFDEDGREDFVIMH